MATRNGCYRATHRTAILFITFVSTMPFLVSGKQALLSSLRKGQLAAFSSHNNWLATPSGRLPMPIRRELAVECKSHYKVLPYRPSGTPLFSSVATNGDHISLDEGFKNTLPFQKHSHNSVKITVTVPDEENDGNADPYNLTTFHSKLQATIAAAQQLHKTAIWITIPMSRARLMEEASKSGFEFHHAEGDVATLSKWLLEEEESRIPTYATHQVGVGAIVINPEGQLLCVREKRNNYRPWKIPGGLAELGEDLDEAVVREVYEETGIPCRFLSVLGVRHNHGLQFGRSDLFFVCRLEPLRDDDGKIPQPVAQEGEIEAVSWQPLSEYREMVNSEDSKKGHPMMKTIMQVVDQGLDEGGWEVTDIQRMIVTSVVPGRKPSPVYHAPIRPNESS
ncbi:hypothetical protein ACHAXR_012416 [Thalassiosira sp. AJA248-18]